MATSAVDGSYLANPTGNYRSRKVKNTPER